MLALRKTNSSEAVSASAASAAVRLLTSLLVPVDYHVARDADGRWVISRQAELVGRFYTEASARDLACCCAVEDAQHGQPARVHVHERRNARLVFVTTLHRLPRT